MYNVVLLTSSTAWINSFPSSCTTLANGGTSEQWGNNSVYGRNTDTISTFKAKWLIYKHAYSCSVSSFVCVCVRSQRTSTSTWLSEPQEIWATELLEVGEGVRNINKLLEDGVKHLQFVLCTDRTYFTGTVAKHPEQRVGVCVYVNNVQTYHSGTLLSRQDSQTRTNRASVWGPKRQIKALSRVRFCRPDPIGTASPHSTA